MSTGPHTQSQELRAARAARVRAARAFAGLDQSVFAEALGVSVGTVKRLERGLRDVTETELQTISELTDVPFSFLLQGFPDQPVDMGSTEPLTAHDAQRAFDQLGERLTDQITELLERHGLTPGNNA